MENKMMNSYPLLLHVNSISSALVFNYYFSYLNRQIDSTNKIYLTYTFKNILPKESFPKEISVQFNTLIEGIFLGQSPTTELSTEHETLESHILQFKFDSTTYEIDAHYQTHVTYLLTGIGDLGFSVEKVVIWADQFNLDLLNKIHLKDDLRQWNEEYYPDSSIQREINQTAMTFQKRNDSHKICQILPRSDRPQQDNGQNAISTMKKTTNDCYYLYKSDKKNDYDEYGRKIVEIRVRSVYYIIMPLSCQFEPNQNSEPIMEGLIFDSSDLGRIKLATANDEVLRSHPTEHYNRYLRRTFYYFDRVMSYNTVIRYLFCAEYPYILRILDQLEKCKQISNAQKQDEYRRFYSMLNRLIQINDLSESVKLISFDDILKNYDAEADYRSLSAQIQEDIDQFYSTSFNNDESSTLIESEIRESDLIRQVLLFYTDDAKNNPSIMTLIRDITSQLKNNNYMVNDAKGNTDLIDTETQFIFICTKTTQNTINQKIIDGVQRKINNYDTLRDVFIFIDDAIQMFSCSFIKLIPYLSFDLNRQDPHLSAAETHELMYYLKNMKILTQHYSDFTEDVKYLNEELLSQCSSIGKGAAAAFCYNYAKLLTRWPEHRNRIELINTQLTESNLIDLSNNKSIFIKKWIFVIPWTIKGAKEFLEYCISKSEDLKKNIGFELSIWKQNNPNDSRISKTIGGIFERSYSGLTIYKLVNIIEGKIFYFPMEIPGVLFGLETQYNDLIAYFNFGHYNPFEQARIFRQKLEEFVGIDEDKSWHNDIIFIYLDKPETFDPTDSLISLSQAESFIKILSKKLSPNS